MSTTAHPQVQRVSHGSNLYLLDGGADGVILIDTGMPGAQRPLNRALSALGKRITDIKHILVTHADMDHIGSLASLKDVTGATVYASEPSKAHIENHTVPAHIPVYLKPFLWPMMPFIKTTTVDVTVQPGTPLDIAGGIVPLATPGHTPDHVAYQWTDGDMIFVGDLFFRIGKLSLTPGVLAWSTSAGRKSASTVLDLGPQHLMVGHGNPLDTKAPADMDEINALKTWLTAP